MAVERTYENAIRIIQSRSRSARPALLSASKASAKRSSVSGGASTLRGTPSISGMVQWLEMTNDIDSLNVIHIAGTKGKGSTAAFAESFLRAHGNRRGFPRTTGLYTSPHLMFPEERIRINSRPLAQTSFTEYFFEVYDRLPQLALPFDSSKEILERGPRSLQLYALLAFHVFIRERVDVSIIETHSGGEYDATNFIHRPIVSAITSLGMDHVDMLGPRIEDIAWHKSGIYKKGTPALSVTQDPAPAAILERRAADKGEELRLIGQDPRLPSHAPQLHPQVQRLNASLAIASAEFALQSCSQGDDKMLTNEDISQGVAQFHWPGRFQIIFDGNWTWYLDSAHNNMSVSMAAQWFAEASSNSPRPADANVTRILIFSHINELRDAEELLKSLAQALLDCDARIRHVIFTSYDEHETGNKNPIADVSNRFAVTWRRFHPNTKTWSEPTIQGAIARAREIGNDGMQTLITGSQHLVGPSLRVLNGTLRHDFS